jgi:Uma2 family endonuclease
MANSFDIPIRRLRRTEYEKLAELGAFENERVELLNGQLVCMSPIGPPHSSTVDRLTQLLAHYLFGRTIVRVQGPFAASDESEPEPDLALLPLGNYSKEHPVRAELLIEVAESSLPYDRGPKLSVYAECGVPEYWIVNLVDRRVEVHRKPGGGRYWQVQYFEEGSRVSPLCFPDFELVVTDILPSRE